jgi:amidohydrolase
MEDLISKIKSSAARNFGSVLQYRRHLHQYPELSFQEINTSNYILHVLNEHDISSQKIGKTGVVGIIKGGKPGKSIALRADIDALPIVEKNNVEYRSKNPGVMHACGHDVHSASLLGSALILKELEKEIQGDIKLIFQPGEEKLPGGASILIKEGVLNNPSVQHIIGQHVHPPLEIGKIGVKPGPFMASADEIYITVEGKGGHGALPHECIDPILIASHLVVSLQQLVSRSCNPLVPSVLTIGKIQSDGGATNIIPEKVFMQGTFRTMDEPWRKEAHIKMKHLAENLTKSMGGNCDFEIRKGYPSLFNNEDLTLKIKGHMQDFMGKENVIDLPIRMTAEDFAYYSQEVPACFYRLGTGNHAKGITSPVHTPTFDIDEKSLEIGSGLMAFLAIRSAAE